MVFTSNASTSSNAIILISPWKRPWRSHKQNCKHKPNDQFFFLFLVRALTLSSRLRCHKWKRNTAQEGFISYVVMFGQWEWLGWILPGFFQAFQWGKSIEHYSSILVAFSRKVNIFSTEYINKNNFLWENEDLTNNLFTQSVTERGQRINRRTGPGCSKSD